MGTREEELGTPDRTVQRGEGERGAVNTILSVISKQHKGHREKVLWTRLNRRKYTYNLQKQSTGYEYCLKTTLMVDAVRKARAIVSPVSH